MPFASNHGVRIHYQIEGNRGPFLVLQHGMMVDADSWRDTGYVEQLEQDFRLVLIDARGHGQSDKPHDPKDYKVSVRAGDVTAVLDDLQVERASFWGVSMGGAIGFGLIWKAPERVDKMVIGGAQLYERPPDSPVRKLLEMGAEKAREFLDEARIKQGSPPLAGEARRKFLANDMTAVKAASEFPWESDPVTKALRRFRRPFLLYCGDQDWGYGLVKRVVDDAPTVQFETLKGIDHPGSWSRSDLVLPFVKEFLLREPGSDGSRSSGKLG